MLLGDAVELGFAMTAICYQTPTQFLVLVDVFVSMHTSDLAASEGAHGKACLRTVATVA